MNDHEIDKPAREQVLVGIASIPEREASLEQVVRALAPQADRIQVSLNGYERIPAFLDDVARGVRDRPER